MNGIVAPAIPENAFKSYVLEIAKVFKTSDDDNFVFQDGAIEALQTAGEAFVIAYWESKSVDVVSEVR